MGIRFGLWQIAAVVVATSALAWIAAPGPREAGVPAKEAEPWQVPRATKALPAAAVDSLTKSGLWGKLPDAPASASLNDPEWRFLGIVRQGRDRFVLVKVEGQPEARLTLHDKLPGGSEIVDIGDDSLCILINGQKRRLAIYKMGPRVL